METNVAFHERNVIGPLSTWISNWLPKLAFCGVTQIEFLLAMRQSSDWTDHEVLDGILSPMLETVKVKGDEAIDKVALLKSEEGVSWASPSLRVGFDFSTTRVLGF